MLCYCKPSLIVGIYTLNMMEKSMIGPRLLVDHEWISRDPFGELEPADRAPAGAADDGTELSRMTAARNGYASCRITVAGQGAYCLTCRADAPVEVDLFRCWYHRVARDASGADAAADYAIDALVPVSTSCDACLPDPDNRIEGQTHQSYWVDLFVPADAPVGPCSVIAVLEADGERIELTLNLDVLDAVVPEESAITCDHNSYGCGWIPGMYPAALAACHDEAERTDLTIGVLHDYYRLCHEHRGLFSNLGTSHSGGFAPIYGPRTEGRGRTKHLAGWDLYDRHYGPLLDGSVFSRAGSGAPPPRREALPVPAVYTPVTPSWPADYLWWGQPGYEVEFVSCLQNFDRHLREKGWTTTRQSFFFNHKKRYRWYEWDGDEAKHEKDNAYLLKMGQLLESAVGGSPVPWTYRLDASWQMKHQFEVFAGMVGLWVCNNFARWYADEIRRVVDRGETVWTYSGTPSVMDSSSALLEHMLMAWARGIHGHCEWLTTSPGPDPWFACDGAATGMLYPGDRFGIAGPIPSARLKIQRNGIQDLTLLSARAAPGDAAARRESLARMVGLALWEDPPPVVRNSNPERWDDTNLPGPDENINAHMDMPPLWWLPVRNAALNAEADR